jgi:S-adenosylmethionine synthetase
LRPDGKTQTTVEYKIESANTIPLRVENILISTQHKPDVTKEEIKAAIMEQVILPIVPTEYLDERIQYFINPSGMFVIGGPEAEGEKSSLIPIVAG